MGATILPKNASKNSKTEPNYFCEIRAAYRLHTANVEVRSSELGTAPIQVVQYAKELFEHAERDHRLPAGLLDFDERIKLCCGVVHCQRRVDGQFVGK